MHPNEKLAALAVANVLLIQVKGKNKNNHNPDGRGVSKSPKVWDYQTHSTFQKHYLYIPTWDPQTRAVQENKNMQQFLGQWP